MFENILGRPSKEEQFANEQQTKSMQFAKEQNVYNQNSQMDTVDLAVQESRTDLLRWQQELEPDLVELILQLKGYVRQADGSWYKPQDAVPLCNDLFINDVVIPQCKPFISRGFINSNLQEDRLLFLLKKTANTIASAMSDGWDMYDIEYIKNDLVLRMIKNVLIPSAFRAVNGWTKKTDSTNIRRIESFNEQPQEKPKGMFRIGS